MRVQVPPRAQTKQRISAGQSTFYGVTVRGLSPDLSHEAALRKAQDAVHAARHNT